MSSPTASQPSASPAEPGGVRWAFALLGGLAAWFVRLLGASALVPVACRADVGVPALWALSAVTALVATAALWWSLRQARRWPAPAAFVASVGVLVNLVALAGIVFESAAMAVLDPCAAA